MALPLVEHTQSGERNHPPSTDLIFHPYSPSASISGEQNQPPHQQPIQDALTTAS